MIEISIVAPQKSKRLTYPSKEMPNPAAHDNEGWAGLIDLLHEFQREFREKDYEWFVRRQIKRKYADIIEGHYSQIVAAAEARGYEKGKREKQCKRCVVGTMGRCINCGKK